MRLKFYGFIFVKRFPFFPRSFVIRSCVWNFVVSFLCSMSFIGFLNESWFLWKDFHFFLVHLWFEVAFKILWLHFCEDISFFLIQLWFEVAFEVFFHEFYRIDSRIKADFCEEISIFDSKLHLKFSDFVSFIGKRINFLYESWFLWKGFHSFSFIYNSK